MNLFARGSGRFVQFPRENFHFQHSSIFYWFLSFVVQFCPIADAWFSIFDDFNGWKNRFTFNNLQKKKKNTRNCLHKQLSLGSNNLSIVPIDSCRHVIQRIHNESHRNDQVKFKRYSLKRSSFVTFHIESTVKMINSILDLCAKWIAHWFNVIELTSMSMRTRKKYLQFHGGKYSTFNRVNFTGINSSAKTKNLWINVRGLVLPTEKFYFSI